MMPFLTYPLALVALASLPMLAAIYILRNRFRKRQVSSLVLWSFQMQSDSAGAKFRRLQLPLLFFLELFVLALLTIAAAGPHWITPQTARPLIVVVDDSISMGAVNGGVSARTRAMQFLESLHGRQPPPNTHVILAGARPRSAGSRAESWQQVVQLLSQWKCASPAAALDSAVALATTLGGGQANMLVLTDHKPPDENLSNPRLEWHAFGAPVDNIAIVNAARTASGGEDRCLLEIANFSPRPQAASLLVQAGSNAPEQFVLQLDPRGSRRLVFNLPATAQSLRASLPGDSLAADNEVELLAPLRKQVRVGLALTNSVLNELASRALDATGLRAAISENPEILISDSGMMAGSQCWSLRWDTRGTNVFTGPFIVDNAHPLAQGLPLEGVVWAGAPMTNAPGEVPAILAGNLPLLSMRDDISGRRHLLLNFNPALSTLQNTPAWPVLFWNILQWRIAAMPGLKDSNVRLGADAIWNATGEPVSVRLPEGTRKNFPPSRGEFVVETPMMGIYSVESAGVTNRLAVNALVADESDLSGCCSGGWGKWTETAERRMVQAPLVWVVGLVALGLLVLHQRLIGTAKRTT